MNDAEKIARAFHDEYESRAPKHGWETQERSRREFDDLPPENRCLMLDVAQALLDSGVIKPGDA